MPDKNKKGFVPEDEEFYQNKEEKVPAVTPPATMPQGAVQMSSAGIATAAQPQQPELNDEQKLAQVNARLLDETSAAHEAGIQSVADFVGALEKEKQARIQEDENYRKRENAFRYIAGLGDTFSGIANLIGTAHGAANQQQTYSATPIAQKAEAARQKRKAGIDNINERIREQKKNLGDLKAAKSLAEAQARMKAEKEMLELRAKNEAEARKQENWAKELEFKQGEADRDYELAKGRMDETARQNARTYNLQLSRFKEEKARYDSKNPKTYPIMLGESGEILDIPIANVNDANVSQIFNSLPEEYRSLAQGKAVTTYDEFGQKQTSYAEPDTEAKLAAIGVAAGADANVQNSLRQLAGKQPVAQKKSTDWSAYKVGGGSK